MKASVDTVALAGRLADRLRLVSLDLTPLDVKCAWPVFRGTCFGRDPLFVKLTAPAAAERALSFLLEAAGRCDLLPRPVLAEPLEFGGLSVLCLEWKPARQVNAEDMTDAQRTSFLDGCLRLSAAMAGYGGAVAAPSGDDPDAYYAKLADYASRHWAAGRLLRPLLLVPEGERTYRGRTLVTIHGDLQPRNYGFDGDRFAAVFDTDDLTKGLPCEDATYAFAERIRRSELPERKRVRALRGFLRMAADSPWPKDEWLVAVNHARLRIAARRLGKHPDSPFVAFDIARRDKPLRRLADALKEGHA